MRALLAVFAHPDDEAFGPGGTLALYAARGVAVHLICATRGEAGDSDAQDAGDREELASRREQELRCAAAELGLSGLHLLGYRDSGMPGWAANRHPRALIQADPATVAAQIAGTMRELQPQVVLTFDPFGVYGHPDHIFIHRATLAAFQALTGAAVAFPRAPASDAPGTTPAELSGRLEKLYCVAPARIFARWLVRLLPLFGGDPEHAGRNHDINLRAAAERQLPVTTVIDIARVYDAKERATACHVSQAPGRRSMWGRMPRWLIRRQQARETFYRASPPFAPGERIELDFFEGIE